MILSTYLSQLDVTSVTVAIVALTLATGLWLLKKFGRRDRRYAIKVAAVRHQVKNHIDLLQEELHTCIARERHNEPMRCFGGPESADKARINQIREHLKGRNTR